MYQWDPDAKKRAYYAGCGHSYATSRKIGIYDTQREMDEAIAKLIREEIRRLEAELAPLRKVLEKVPVQ